MITYNHLFSDMQSFSAFLETNGIDPSARMLVRIHTALHGKQELPNLIAQMQQRLPHAEIVGCNSLSVIYNGRHMNKVCMISLTLTEDAFVKTAYVPCFTEDAAIPGDQLARVLADALTLEGKRGVLLVFLPQQYYTCSLFAQTISAIAPDVRLIGGISDSPEIHGGADGRLDMTFTKEGCGNRAAAAALIADDQLLYCSKYALGVECVSDPHRVTAYAGNILLGVDGKSPKTFMKDIVGEMVVKENREIFDILPLIRMKRANTAWPIQFVDEGEYAGGLRIMDELEEDEELKIGYVNPNVVAREVMRLYGELKRQPIESLFVYSCTLRHQILRNCSKWELSPLADTCASGAFLGGEFFYDGETCKFGNCTYTVTSLATREVYLPLNTQTLSNTHSLQHDNEHLVDYLTACTMGKRGGIYSEMKSRLYADRGEELGNLTKLSFDIQVHKLNKLCLLTVKNASELIAYAGYRSYDFMIQEVICKMQEFLREQPMRYYLSEQGELLLAAGDAVAGDAFERLMRELDDYLTLTEYQRLRPVFEFCVVINEVNLLRNAKVVQSVLQTRTDQRFMVYTPGMGLEERSVHDVEMLSVINDAIAHRRVMPYYQGIYDNVLQKITMYESLMRLSDEDGKLYFPNDFFPVAKKYGLYGDLSRQMIDKVMLAFADREEQVTMNLSMQDIQDERMTNLIYGHMKQASCPQKYVFEVVETEDVHDYELLGQFADRIHAYGGKIALDDFGSGFSNLVHVLGLDLDYLKVDGGIIRKVCIDPDCRSLLELVAMWCKHHAKKIIAEYVENSDIQQVLCSYQVDYSQGYYFSRPERRF